MNGLQWLTALLIGLCIGEVGAGLSGLDIGDRIIKVALGRWR